MSITLHTAIGREIENIQSLEVDGSEWSRLPLFSNKYSPLELRHEPTGAFNCHGLSFAQRRTWVVGLGDDLAHILKDDSYQEVDKNSVLPGDLILYYDEQGGAIAHSGLVVEISTILPRKAKVCSKWGSSCEYLHWADQSPYGHEMKYFRVKR